MNLSELVSMSNRYGADEAYVLAGGGNTSYKEHGVMYVKGSGTSLATIKAEQFVAMDMPKLTAMLTKQYPAEDAARESAALEDMMSARLVGEEHKRPSVEAILHAIFPQTFVLHTHPAIVNGLSCGNKGEAICQQTFGDTAVWIPLTKPGYILSTVCQQAFNERKQKTGQFPQIVILQNHGLFIAADTVADIDDLMREVMAKLTSQINEHPDFSDAAYDDSAVQDIKPTLQKLYAENAAAFFCTNKQALSFLTSANALSELAKPFTPDHIVYCKHTPLIVSKGDNYADAFDAYTKTNGFAPKIVCVVGLGFFALGKNENEANIARMLFIDAMKVAVYARSFGGVLPLPDEFTQFILHWEIESYRQKVSAS